jgi:hypothetical protein
MLHLFLGAALLALTFACKHRQPDSAKTDSISVMENGGLTWPDYLDREIDEMTDWLKKQSGVDFGAEADLTCSQHLSTSNWDLETKRKAVGELRYLLGKKLEYKRTLTKQNQNSEELEAQCVVAQSNQRAGGILRFIQGGSSKRDEQISDQIKTRDLLHDTKECINVHILLIQAIDDRLGRLELAFLSSLKSPTQEQISRGEAVRIQRDKSEHVSSRFPNYPRIVVAQKKKDALVLLNVMIEQASSLLDNTSVESGYAKLAGFVANFEKYDSLRKDDLGAELLPKIPPLNSDITRLRSGSRAVTPEFQKPLLSAAIEQFRLLLPMLADAAGRLGDTEAGPGITDSENEFAAACKGSVMARL